jgi:hypothetical protein
MLFHASTPTVNVTIAGEAILLTSPKRSCGGARLCHDAAAGRRFDD